MNNSKLIGVQWTNNKEHKSMSSLIIFKQLYRFGTIRMGSTPYSSSERA